jgi:hypothetical protein
VFVLHFLDHSHISPDVGLLPSGIAALLHLLLSFSGVDMDVDVVGFSVFTFLHIAQVYTTREAITL